MASQCKRQQCTIDRRGFRQELDSWRHKLIHCVGFESIIEGLFGPELVEDLKLYKDVEPTAVTDWSFDENCLFCCLRRDKVKEHLIGLGHEGLEDTPKPLQVRDQTTISRLEKQAEEFLHAVLSRKDVPNFSDPHIPVVAREILQRMIKQFAAEYTSKSSSSQDTCSDSQPLSDQSLPTPPLIPGASPCTSPAPTVAGPAHSQNPVLSKLLMADQDAPLDLTIKKPLAVPSDQDGVLDLSIKKNRYSSSLPVRSPCLSPATPTIKGESSDFRISKAKDLQSSSTLEQFMAKLCRHHQRQIVDAIGFLQTEVKALASPSPHQDSISTSGIQGTTCSMTSSVTSEKSLGELPSESTPKSEVQDMSHSIRGSCATKNVPEKVASLKTSIAASPTLDPCSSGLGSNPTSVTPNANPVDSENKHHSDHAPLRLKIMTSNAAAGKRLSYVLNTSLSPLSDTSEDRECNSDLHNRTETHSARLSSSNKRHSQSSNIHQARQKETLRHAKDSPTKLYSVHMTIPPDSPRTARKTIRASPEHQIRDSAYKTLADPDLGRCDIVFIDKPITECFKKRHSGMVPRRNARKSTRGHMYSGEVWELKTVRTLAGRGNCHNPMPELMTLAPKQVLSKPEGVPPVDMPFAGACTETMIQQMSTEQSDESVIPGTEDTVEVAASEVDIVVETSQTGQSQNMGQPVLLSLERLPSESTETDFNTDVEEHIPAVSGTTTGCEESFGQVASEAEKDVVPEPKEEIHENTKQMVAETVNEKIEGTIVKEPEPRLPLDEGLTSESIVEQISITEPMHQVEEETETEERKIVKERDEQPKEMWQETLKHNPDTEVTEKLVTQTHNENTEVSERPETPTQNMDAEVTEKPEIQTHNDQTEVQEKQETQTHNHGTEVTEKPVTQSHNDKTEVLEKPETLTHKDTAEVVEKSDLQACYDKPEVREKLEMQIHSEDTEFTEKSDTQTLSDNTEGTEKPVAVGSEKQLMTEEPDIKTSEAVDSVVSETEGGDEDDSGYDLSSKTLDSLLKELPPWRRKKGTVVSLPKRLRHTEDVVVGYVNGRPVSASDRSLRRRSGSSISPNQTPVKTRSSNKKNLVDPISGLTAEDKNDEKHLPETPEKYIEMSPVTDQVKEPSPTSSPTSETPSKLKQTNKQKKTQLGPDSVLVCSDQLDGQSQSMESKRKLRSASQKPVESQTTPPTSNNDPSISVLELTTIAFTPSTTENPTPVPHSSSASISDPQVRSVSQKPVESQASTPTTNNDLSISMPKLAATTHSPSTEDLTLVPHSSAPSFSAPQVSSPPASEQSQENNDQETTVELNTEKILLETTASKDVQKDHVDDGSQDYEQSQENKDQEITVELNTEKIQQEVTAFKDVQTHNIEDRSQARQKLRSAMVVEEGNKKQQLNSEESNPLEEESVLKDEIRSTKTITEEKKEKLQPSLESSVLENQSPAKTEMPSQSIAVKSRRVHRTEVEALKMDPKVATLEDWSASGDDSSSDRPTRMPLRSERSKIAASQQPTPHTLEDNKKLALRSQRLASPSNCAVTVAEKQSEVASPVRIMPERITKGPEKSPPVPVTSDLPHRSSIPATTRHEPPKQANKFFETLNGEENQHLISNLNLKYDKMQRGWVQMDKDGQPVIKHKNKADRQAAIWKSKRRTKKPKSLEHQRYSPVQMLFMKGFNLTSICRWFLESTETKSLVIVKKVNTRLPSETQLCFHSSSSVSGTSQGVFPSLQAERLKKHLKKFAIASPVKSNPKSQKLIAKALEQESIIVKGKEKRELPSTGPTMMKSKASAAATVQISESQKSSGKSKNPASARILRKYSNIREKMQVQQTNERLSKASKTLKNNNLKRLTTTKPTAKSLLRPSQKAQKSQQPICKQIKESAAKIEKRKILSDKKAKKQLVQDKADKKLTKQPVQDKVDRKPTKQPTKDKVDKKPPVQDKADTTSKQPVQDKVDLGTTKQPVQDKADKKITKQPVQDKADKKPTKQPVQDKVDKKPTKQPVHDKIDKKPTRQPVQNKIDKKPTKKPVQDKADKTTKQPAQDKTDKRPAKQNVQDKADTTSKTSAKDKVDKKPTKQPVQDQTEKSSKQSVQDKTIKTTKQPVQDKADQNITEQPVQDKQADRHLSKQPVQDEADISSKQPVQDKQEDQFTKQLVQDQEDKQNTKQPVQEKVVKAQSSVKASKETIRKEMPKRSSLRLASPKMPDHNVVKTPEVDSKKQMETERVKLEQPTVSKINAAKTQTSEPYQGAVVESKMPEDTVQTPRQSMVPVLPDQVLTRSQRKMETVVPASGSTSPALKRSSKSMTQTQSKSQTASPKLVKKADKPTVTRSGAVKSPAKRNRPASPPRSSTKTSAKKTQQLSETPAKRTRTR